MQKSNGYFGILLLKKFSPILISTAKFFAFICAMSAAETSWIARGCECRVGSKVQNRLKYFLNEHSYFYATAY